MSTYLFPILHILSDGCYHSAKSIAQKLNCSQYRIFSEFKEIERLSCRIEKTSFHGFKWLDPIRWLDKQVILDSMPEITNSFNIKTFNSIDSTNTHLIRNSSYYQSDSRIPVILAELQTDGHGRYNRPWHAGLGEALTFSLMWRFDISISRLSGLSLVVAIALVRVLRTIANVDIKIKWPNDLVYHNHKLGGILIELRGNNLGSIFPIIGIGINFNLSEHTKTLTSRIVTDLTMITGVQLDRNIILGKLLTEIYTTLNEFSYFGFPHFRHEWLEYHVCEGKKVQLRLPSGQISEGIVDGVNDNGAIAIIINDCRQYYNAGEISLCLNEMNYVSDSSY